MKTCFLFFVLFSLLFPVFVNADEDESVLYWQGYWDKVDKQLNPPCWYQGFFKTSGSLTCNEQWARYGEAGAMTVLAGVLVAGSFLHDDDEPLFYRGQQWGMRAGAVGGLIGSVPSWYEGITGRKLANSKLRDTTRWVAFPFLQGGIGLMAFGYW